MYLSAQFGESALTRSSWRGEALACLRRRGPEGATGQAIGYDTTGTVTVAPMRPIVQASTTSSPTSTRSASVTAAAPASAGARPALSPALRGGIEVPGDHHVDNRALLGALVEACRRGGVTFVEGTVAALAAGPELVLADGHRSARTTSSWRPGPASAPSTGCPAPGSPTRPVKGHILRPRAGRRGDRPVLGRTVRGLAHGRSVYLVPRRHGSVVVGATVEERGSDTAVRVGAVHEALNDVVAVVPGIDELELAEAATGLRPATADNQPRDRVDGTRRRAGGRRPLPQRRAPGAAHCRRHRRPPGPDRCPR